MFFRFEIVMLMCCFEFVNGGKFVVMIIVAMLRVCKSFLSILMLLWLSIDEIVCMVSSVRFTSFVLSRSITSS